jgi:ferric-dicitrate binding protein FerR (iron transport regulator)
MSQPRGAEGSAEQASAILAELVDQLTARIQAGERIDWREIARRHPEHVAELRQLWSTLGALQELSQSGEPVVADLAEYPQRPARRPTLLQRLFGWLRRRSGGAMAMFAILAISTQNPNGTG